MLGIVDYGAGNLFSVQNALKSLQIESRLITDCKELDVPEQSGLFHDLPDGLILPGVGAFPDAMERLRKTGLDKAVVAFAQTKPLLGICLGMQLLFEQSEEFGLCSGLGLIPGRVEKFTQEGLKIPHMGWNLLQLAQPCPLTEGCQSEQWVYFVHSYRAVTSPAYVAAYVDYGDPFPALVMRQMQQGGLVLGAQFHPEKSGNVGLAMLQKFTGICQANRNNQTAAQNQNNPQSRKECVGL